MDLTNLLGILRDIGIKSHFLFFYLFVCYIFIYL